jgi:hypothetical protein
MTDASNPPLDPDDYPGEFPPQEQTQRLLQIRREVARAADYMCLSCGATVYETNALYMVVLPHQRPIERFTVRDFGVRCAGCCPEPAQQPALEIVPPSEHEEPVYTTRSPLGIAAVDPDVLGPIRPPPEDANWNQYHELGEDGTVPVGKRDWDTDETWVVDATESQQRNSDPDRPTTPGVKPADAPIEEVDGVTWVFDGLRDSEASSSRSTPGRSSQQNRPTSGRPPGEPVTESGTSSNSTTSGGGSAFGDKLPDTDGSTPDERKVFANAVITWVKLCAGTLACWLGLLGFVLASLYASSLNDNSLVGAFGKTLVTSAMEAPVAAGVAVLLGAPVLTYGGHLVHRLYAHQDPFFPLILPEPILDSVRNHRALATAIGYVLVVEAGTSGGLQQAIIGAEVVPSSVLYLAMAGCVYLLGTAAYAYARDIFRSEISVTAADDQTELEGATVARYWGTLMRAFAIGTPFGLLVSPRYLGLPSFTLAVGLYTIGIFGSEVW